MKAIKIIVLLSFLLSLLILTANLSGLLFPRDIYMDLTPNWYTQSVGQDAADLFLALPVLIISSILVYRNNKKAMLVWAGTIVYFMYTFVIYCFDVPFNRLFIVYCLVLGISTYLFLWFLFSQSFHARKWTPPLTMVKPVGVFLILTGTLFYLLWLSAIVPATISNVRPNDLVETGLLTNPVHVLDLSVVLPGIIMTGIFLLRRHYLGTLMAAVVLTFFVLMDLTIALLMIIMNQKGFEVNIVVMSVIFLLAIISAVMLMIYLRQLNTVRRAS